MRLLAEITDQALLNDICALLGAKNCAYATAQDYEDSAFLYVRFTQAQNSKNTQNGFGGNYGNYQGVQDCYEWINAQHPADINFQDILEATRPKFAMVRSPDVAAQNLRNQGLFDHDEAYSSSGTIPGYQPSMMPIENHPDESQLQDVKDEASRNNGYDDSQEVAPSETSDSLEVAPSETSTSSLMSSRNSTAFDKPAMMGNQHISMLMDVETEQGLATTSSLNTAKSNGSKDMHRDGTEQRKVYKRLVFRRVLGDSGHNIYKRQHDPSLTSAQLQRKTPSQLTAPVNSTSAVIIGTMPVVKSPRVPNSTHRIDPHSQLSSVAGTSNVSLARKKQQKRNHPIRVKDERSDKQPLKRAKKAEHDDITEERLIEIISGVKERDGEDPAPSQILHQSNAKSIMCRVCKRKIFYSKLLDHMRSDHPSFMF